jgi:transposase
MDQRTKQIIESEKDPRILRALIGQMADFIESQKNLIVQLEAEKLAKEQSSFLIEEKVKLLRRALYGKSREDRPDASDRPRDSSQSEALIFSDAAFPIPKSIEGKKDRWGKLETQTIDHVIDDGGLEAESKLRGLKDPSASQWSELPNVFDAVTKIQVIERRYVKELHRKLKYKLKSEFADEVDGKDIIITANCPASLLPGMNYSTDFVASVVADKYISHMPLERQTREMQSLGLDNIKNSTLSRLCALAAASLEKVQEEILSELRQTDLALHIDETPWKIQNKNEKDGYL